MSVPGGLRERKKQQTREAIAAAALRLFSARGFDAVPVAEIAQLAEVSEATVFNYFPTKEDLVYRGLETFETELLAAIRDREPEQSIPQAFRAFVIRTQGSLASPATDAIDTLTAITRIITASPALLSRERQIYDRYTRGLAQLIAAEVAARPDDIEPFVVANALMGVHRALVEHVRGGVLAGKSAARLARTARTQANQAFATLERGVANYASRRPISARARDAAASQPAGHDRPA